MAYSTPAVDVVEAFVGPFVVLDKRHVARVNVACQQLRRVGVGARHDERRHAHHVGRQAGRHQLLLELADRHQHLAAHVAALLGRRELVLEVHARGAGFDHKLHQLERVERAAKA